MGEERKLYIDLLKGVALGSFGAVVFRESTLTESVLFTILGVAALLGARALIRRSR